MIRWWHRLALVMGVPSVRRLKEMIDTGEFYDWFAFLESEPIGPFAENVQLARFAAMFANANGGNKTLPQHFLVALTSKKAMQAGSSDDEIADAFRGLAKARGA